MQTLNFFLCLLLIKAASCQDLTCTVFCAFTGSITADKFLNADQQNFTKSALINALSAYLLVPQGDIHFLDATDTMDSKKDKAVDVTLSIETSESEVKRLQTKVDEEQSHLNFLDDSFLMDLLGPMGIFMSNVNLVTFTLSCPTLASTHAPSYAPSHMPSLAPTYITTSAPSVEPSIATDAPTVAETLQPTTPSLGSDKKYLQVQQYSENHKQVQCSADPVNPPICAAIGQCFQVAGGIWNILELHAIDDGSQSEVKATAYSDSECKSRIDVSPIHAQLEKIKFTANGCTRIDYQKGEYSILSYMIYF